MESTPDEVSADAWQKPLEVGLLLPWRHVAFLASWPASLNFCHSLFETVLHLGAK